MGIGIRHQRQVADPFIRLDISYVAHPYLVRPGRDYVCYQVRILAIVMPGVGRPVMTPAFEPYHQSVLAEKFYKGVAAGHAATLTKQPFHNQVQLCTAKAGVIPSVFVDLFYNQRFDGVLGKLPVIMFIVGLSATTKQPAKSAQTIFRAFLA